MSITCAKRWPLTLCEAKVQLVSCGVDLTNEYAIVDGYRRIDISGMQENTKLARGALTINILLYSVLAVGWLLSAIKGDSILFIYSLFMVVAIILLSKMVLLAILINLIFLAYHFFHNCLGIRFDTG